MAFWLLKSEPDEFSIDALEQCSGEWWTGVRNYQARNFLRQMQPGELFYFYHSSCAVPGIAGIGRIAKTAQPDATQFVAESDYFDPKSTVQAPRWWCPQVAFVAKAEPLIELETLRAQQASLDGLALLQRGTRLSVIPISDAHWQHIYNLRTWKPNVEPTKPSTGTKTRLSR
jgi:predicted RNA-binding protein with PUA-like domain